MTRPHTGRRHVPARLGHFTSRLRLVTARLRLGATQGMTTAEYAVGTLAACAFAAVLIAVVRSGPIRAALARIITTALSIAG